MCQHVVWTLCVGLSLPSSPFNHYHMLVLYIFTLNCVFSRMNLMSLEIQQVVSHVHFHTITLKVCSDGTKSCFSCAWFIQVKEETTHVHGWTGIFGFCRSTKKNNLIANRSFPFTYAASLLGTLPFPHSSAAAAFFFFFCGGKYKITTTIKQRTT
jgi:hypothetical protein